MPPLSSRDHLLQAVIVRALTSPVSLFLGASGLLLVLSPAAWPYGLAVLAAEAGWVASRVCDPRSARASAEELQRQRWRDLIDRLEALTSVLDRETASLLSAIAEAHERLLALYGAGDALVPHTRTELTALLEHCLSLAEKRHHLQTFLASHRIQEAQRQAAELQTRLERSHDAVTRDLYYRALEQKRQELGNYARLQEAIGRIDGQLVAVQCTCDNVLSQVVRMQSLHAETEHAELDPVFIELNRLTSGIAALEDSLNETLTLRGAA
jgi:chromosome segregation ATPase